MAIHRSRTPLPVVFANTAPDYVRFRFRSDKAVCRSTRPISVGGAAEILRDVSLCLRFSIAVRAHNLRMSGALKLKWLGKSLWCERADVAGRSVEEIHARLRHAWRSSTWAVHAGSIP